MHIPELYITLGAIKGLKLPCLNLILLVKIELNTDIQLKVRDLTN